METILVTGGCGFIGSHTVVELLECGYNVVIADNLCNSRIETLDGIEKITGKKPEFELVDLSDYNVTESLFEKYPNINGVIHFAAYKAVGESVENPLNYYRNNIISLLNILQQMTTHNVPAIIFSSSCTVYGQPEYTNLPVSEHTEIQKAKSPYGNTKQIDEEIIQDFIRSESSVKSIILRYFNPIGAHPSAEIGELPIGIPLNLVPFVTQTAMGIRSKLKIFGNDYNTPDGTCIRDYIYVVDLAKAHVKALNRVLHEKCPNIDIFNISTGRGISTLEIVNTFEKATGVKLAWEFAPRRTGDVEQIWGSADKANRELGWKSETPLEDVLLSAWRWQLKLKNERLM